MKKHTSDNSSTGSAPTLKGRKESHTALFRLASLACRLTGAQWAVVIVHDHPEASVGAARAKDGTVRIPGDVPIGVLGAPDHLAAPGVRVSTDPRDALISQFGAAFALSVPIPDAAGGSCGRLCVLDAETRDWPESIQEDLRTLAEMAADWIPGVSDPSLTAQAGRNSTGFRRLFHDNPLPMWVYDTETLQFLDVNEASENLYGYSRQEFLSMRITDIRPAEDLPRLLEQVARPMTSFTLAGNWRHLRKDGTVMTVHITSHLMEFEGRTAKLVVVRDETGRVQLEQDLAESHRTMQAIVDASPIAIVTLDKDGTVIQWSSAAERIFGWNAEEVIGRHYPLVPEEREEEFWTNLQSALNGQIITNLETTRRTKDGVPLDVSLSTAQLQDAQGHIIGCLAMLADITSRRNAERRLEESQERLQSLYTNNIAAIGSFDLEGRLLGCNSAAAGVTGYTEEELLGRGFFDLMIPDAQKRLFQRFFLQVRSGSKDAEFTVRHRSGRLMRVQVMGIPTIVKGEVVGVYMVGQDITERKEAERRLQESERRFRNLLQNVQMVSVLLDTEGQVTFCNDYLLSLTGYQREDILGRSWFDVFLPDDVREDVRRMFLDNIATESLPLHHENEIQTRAGERRLISWDNTVLRDANDAVVGSASIGSDITEARAAERALRASEKKNRAIVDAIPDLLFRIRGDGTCLECLSSPDAWLLAPWCKEAGGQAFDVLPLEQLPRLAKAALRTGDIQVFEYTLPHNGEERYFEARMVMSGDNEVLLIARDITHRRRAEQTLHRREQEFRALVDHAPDIIARLDADTRFVYVNPVVESVFGVSPSDCLGKSWEELGVPPDLIAMWRPCVQDVFFRGTERVLEYAVPTVQGVRYFQTRYVPEFGPGGAVESVLAISRDISERKRAEDLGKGQNRVLEMITTNAPLEESLAVLVDKMEALLGGATCSVFLLDASGARVDACVAPRLPEAVRSLLAGLAVEPESTTLGAAIARRERVVTKNIASDPLWKEHGDVLMDHGYVACSAEPVRTSSGARLGVFAVFYTEACPQHPDDLQFLTVAAHVAGIALERARSESERETLMRQLEAERALLESVLQHLPAGVVLAEAPSGRVLLGNEEARRIMGQGHDPSVELDRYDEWLARTAEGDKSDSKRLPLARAILHGEFVPDEEWTVRRTDGSLITLSVNAAPIQDRDGRVIAAVTTFQDITKRRRSEENSRLLSEVTSILASSLDYETTLTQTARQMVPNLADACIVTLYRDDQSPRTVAVIHEDAKQAERLRKVHAAYMAESERNAAMPNVRRNGRADALFEVTKDNLEGSGVSTEQADLMVEAGIVSLMAVPLDARGRTQGSLVFYNDMSGRRFNEDDLTLAEEIARRAALVVDNARLYHEILRADRVKDEFLAMLGHELRNPLGAISNALQLVRLRGVDEGPLLRTLGILERQTRHMARLVDDLLDVSRITRGKISLRRETVLLTDIVDQAVQTNKPLMEAKGHRLSVTLPDEAVWLEADPVRIGQVIANLLNNAAKYTEPGGDIALTARQQERFVVLSVRDNGVGIPEDLLPRVFDLFTQAERTLDRSLGGLGVGLTVVRNLVEMHGGDVRAFSEGPGKGSEFVVRLPSIPPSSVVPKDAREWAGSTGAVRTRVLVVDDNVDAAEALSSILELWGYEVRVAHEGETAIEVARTFEPAAVLMDIGLPGMDGYEVARRMKESLNFRGALIAVTGYGQQDDKERSSRAGFQYHLVKPVETGALAKLLNEIPA